MGLTTQTFDILTRVAIGNGALVYRAVEKNTLRQVALKLLTQDGELDHRFDLPALFAAVPLLKQISGTHVCQLLDAFEDDDGPVLVYEFAAGLSGALLPRERKLDAGQALDVASQVISALRSGERQRIPHGDLKPGNFVFADHPEGRLYTLVLDWSLAAFRAELMDDSLSYLAPERLAGASPSHQADLFSAGVVLFFFLTGKVLVAGQTAEEVLAGWSRVRPEILGELRPDLPPRFVQWIVSLLALDPAKRPASAIEASSALATLNPPPPLAPPETFRPRPAPVRPSISPSSAQLESSVPRAVSSGVRSPVGSGVASSPHPSARLPAKPVVPPKSKAGLVAVLSVLLIGSCAAGGWWLVHHQKERGAPVAAASASGARTPAPSVIEPASVPKLAEAKPASPPPENANPGIGKITDAEMRKIAAAKVPAAPAPAPAPAKMEPAPAPPSAPAPANPLPAPKPAEKPLVLNPIYIARESFEYPAGTDFKDLNGGGGWAGSWRGSAKLESSSLNLPGYPSTGGALLLPPGEEVTLSRKIGPLSRFLPQPERGGHWYFSVLVRHSDDTPEAGGEVHFNPIDRKGSQGVLGCTVTDTGPGLSIMLGAPKLVVNLPDANKPVLLMLRVNFANPKDNRWDGTVSMVVNPNLRANSFASSGASFNLNIAGVPNYADLGLFVRKSAGKATTQIDEIRFGQHWEDMTCQPPKPPQKAIPSPFTPAVGKPRPSGLKPIPPIAPLKPLKR